MFSLMFAHLHEPAARFLAENPQTDLKAFYQWASQQAATSEQEMMATLDAGGGLAHLGVMTSEADEFFYHENLVHPAAVAHPLPRRALVIGGGACFRAVGAAGRQHHRDGHHQCPRQVSRPRGGSCPARCGVSDHGLS